METIIKPFRATHYNTALFKDHSDVVCPPYDAINEEQLKNLRKKSAYNFSHIILADNNDYQEKRKKFEDLRAKTVLVDDERECFYLYEQKYRVAGKAITRYGIITLLKMDKKSIFPHEKTHKAPKEDRKKMIRALEANLSPIFVIAGKRVDILNKLHVRYAKKKPFIHCKDQDGNDNRLWRIYDKKEIAALSSAVSNTPLFIADGHHRFEISYDYFKKHQHKYKDLDYVLAYVADLQKGLMILPTHRILGLNESRQTVLSTLKKYFKIKQSSQTALDKTLSKAKKFCMGIYADRKFYFLKLKNDEFLSKIPNTLFRPLDAYVFHKLILPLFSANGNIEYSHTISEAKELVGKGKIAFLLRAASLDSVVAISSAGFRMPQKSTYFYPKLLSGLLVRRFVKHE